MCHGTRPACRPRSRWQIIPGQAGTGTVKTLHTPRGGGGGGGAYTSCWCAGKDGDHQAAIQDPPEAGTIATQLPQIQIQVQNTQRPGCPTIVERLRQVK